VVGREEGVRNESRTISGESVFAVFLVLGLFFLAWTRDAKISVGDGPRQVYRALLLKEV